MGQGEVDFWVVSDRVLSVAPDGAKEEALALGVCKGRVVRREPASLLRQGPLFDRAKLTGAPVYELAAAPVVPGFVNAHTHLALAPLRGVTNVANRSGNVIGEVYFRLESFLSGADVRSFTRMGAYESLLCGVTEVWDHYYFGHDVARALLEVGLCGVVAPTLQDLAGPGVKTWQTQLADTLDLSTDAELRAAGISTALGPHATDTVSDELLERVGDLARTHSLPVHLHAAQTFEEFRQAAARYPSGIGRGLLEALVDTEVLLAHGLFLSEAECRALAGASFTLAYCPLSQIQFGFLGPLDVWRSRGGRWAVGTDCVASNDALDVQRELPWAGGEAALGTSFSCERTRLLSGESSAAACLEAKRVERSGAIAIEPAELLAAAYGMGLPARGHGPAPLSVGSSANFLVLDPNHPALYPDEGLARTLAYGSTHGAIRWMCVRGKTIGMRDGLSRELLSSDSYQECLTEAQRRRDELFERARMHSAAPSG